MSNIGGYTLRIAREVNKRYYAAVEAGRSPSLGVSLGKGCIDNNIPVDLVSSELGVSRQTIYNWFAEDHEPSDSRYDDIAEFIQRRKARPLQDGERYLAELR